MSGLQREAVWAAAGYFVLLNLLFFPFVWGHANLLSSARDIPSVYPQGAAGNSPPLAQRMLLDDVGSGATVEPAAAVEHRIIFTEHRLPLWNRDEAFGMPLAAAMQEGTFCPFDFLNEIDPSPKTYPIYVVARLFVAAIFAFLFLRFFVCAPAAFGGGIAFMLTGYFILFCSMPHLSIECLIPAAFYFTERLIRFPTIRNTSVLAILAGLLFIGGFPEATLLATLFATSYLLMRLASKVSLGGNTASIGGFFALAFALGIGSAAVLLVPFSEFVATSFTTHPAGGDVLPRGITDIDGPASTLLGAYLAPLSLGPVWHGLLTGGSDYNSIRGYWGVAAFFFACIATVRLCSLRLLRLDAWVSAFFFAFVVGLLAKRFGSPLINWIGYLPGLKQVVFNKYEEPLLGFAIAVLCAFGLDAALRGRLTIRSWGIATVATLAMLTYGDHNLRAAIGPLAASHYFVYAYWLAIAVFLCVASITYLLARPQRNSSVEDLRRFAPAVAVALIVIELSTNFYLPLWFGANVQPNKETNPYAGAPFVSYLKEHLKPGERIFGEQAFLWPNWSGAFDLADIRGNEAIYEKRYLPFVRAFISPNDCDLNVAFVGCQDKRPDDAEISRLLTLAGVRYVVTPRELFNPRFKVVYQADATIYRIDDNPIRARLFHDVRIEASGDRVLTRLTDLSTDVGKTAFLEEDDSRELRGIARKSASSNDAKGDSVAIVTDSSQLVSLKTKSGRPGLLVLSDTFYPGWDAYVDGKPTQIERADYLFRGVYIDAGSHSVEFKYEPRSYAFGEAISAAFIAVILAGLLFSGKRRKTQTIISSAAESSMTAG